MPSVIWQVQPRPEFKESSQHRVDRGAVTYEIGEGEAAEAGVAGVAAGSA
jgi:hypothetical protein